MRPSPIPPCHRLTTKVVDGLETLRHDEFQTAMDLRRAEQGNLFALSRFGVEVLDVLDDDVTGIIEQSRLEFPFRLNLNDFDMDAVVTLGHRFNAVDDRRAVVIAIGKPDGSHWLSKVKLERARRQRRPL